MQRFSHQTAKVADLKDADLKDADLKVADLNPLKTNQKKELIKISTFWGLFKGNISRNFEEDGNEVSLKGWAKKNNLVLELFESNQFHFFKT